MLSGISRSSHDREAHRDFEARRTRGSTRRLSTGGIGTPRRVALLRGRLVGVFGQRSKISAEMAGLLKPIRRWSPSAVMKREQRFS